MPQDRPPAHSPTESPPYLHPTQYQYQYQQRQRTRPSTSSSIGSVGSAGSTASVRSAASKTSRRSDSPGRSGRAANPSGAAHVRAVHSKGERNPPGTAGTVASSTTTLSDDEGLSAWLVCSADPLVKLYYVSESMQDILGWSPSEMIGKSLYDYFHADELVKIKQSHYSTLADEKLACVVYYRIRHREGHYVEICCSYYTVFDMCLGLYTRAVEGRRPFGQVLTAREVFEITPSLEKRFAHSMIINPSVPPPVVNPAPTPRTFYIIDRFTETSRVMYASNDIITNATSLQNQPFYSIIRPSDRPLVRDYIQAAKSVSPIQYNEQRSGGHEYARFHVLKIPDLPPCGSLWPQGTDNSERSMPGQEFILVEGIFTAGSDGLACIIERVRVPKDKAMR